MNHFIKVEHGTEALISLRTFLEVFAEVVIISVDAESVLLSLLGIDTAQFNMDNLGIVAIRL